MEGYTKCEVCGKPLKMINAAHLKTHNMTLEEYNEFIQSKKRKKPWKSIPTIITGIVSGIIGNLLTPLVKSFLSKIYKLPAYLKGLTYKLIIAIVSITVISSIVIYKLYKVKLPPPKPVIPIESESEAFPDDVPLDTLKIDSLEISPSLSLQVSAILHLRSQPKILSSEDVTAIIEKYDLFDSWRNENGKGISNQFEIKNIRGNKIVIDKTTGLIWQKSGLDEIVDIEEAEMYIDKINKKGYAGHQDWRLPTLEEAMSLMESKKKNGDLYIDPVFNSEQRWIWTSDQLSNDGFSWIVDYFQGYCIISRATYIYSYVRAVRSG